MNNGTKCKCFHNSCPFVLQLCCGDNVKLSHDRGASSNTWNLLSLLLSQSPVGPFEDPYVICFERCVFCLFPFPRKYTRVRFIEWESEIIYVKTGKKWQINSGRSETALCPEDLRLGTSWTYKYVKCNKIGGGLWLTSLENIELPQSFTKKYNWNVHTNIINFDNLNKCTYFMAIVLRKRLMWSYKSFVKFQHILMNNNVNTFGFIFVFLQRQHTTCNKFKFLCNTILCISFQFTVIFYEVKYLFNY